jgi:hypothetical protein
MSTSRLTDTVSGISSDRIDKGSVDSKALERCLRLLIDDDFTFREASSRYR